MSGLTADLGRLVAEAPLAPVAARQVAHQGVVDAIGVMLAAHREPVVCALRQTLGVGHDTHHKASVLFGPERTRSDEAAMINATAAHAFAMDDVAAGCHPSAILLPALWAEAEALGASGERLLDAYVIGYQVLAEIASREPDALHSTGWHPTAQLGPIAVAAAVARLHRHSPSQARHAIAMASSMTGGVMANFGTPTKALHAGRTAQSGILAARLAAAGVTANEDALDSPTGLLSVLSPHKRIDLQRPVAQPGPHWAILEHGLSIKQYPVCYSTHRVVDGARQLRAAPGFAAARIDRVEVQIGSKQAWMARHEQPRTVLEAKYSVEFAVAAGLLAGGAGFGQLQPEFLQRPDLHELMARIERHLDERENPEDPIFSPSDRIRIWLSTGEVLDSGEIAYAHGHARHPLTAEALRQKFVDCVAAGGRQDGERLFEALQALDTVTDLGLWLPDFQSRATVDA